MYYIFLTLIIIIVYFTLDKIYTPTITETFSPSPAICYGNAPGCIDRDKKIDYDKDSLIILPKFKDKTKEVEINLELVYLNPKYELETSTYLYGKKNTFSNTDWKQDFSQEICHTKKGGCQCIKDINNDTVCGVPSNNYIYECPGACPECKQCHQNKNKLTLRYQEFCNKSHTQEEKKKCQIYQERLLYSKENCFFNKSKDPRLIKKKDNCDMFLPSRYNGYLIGQDILFRLSIQYKNEDIKDKVSSVEIDRTTLDKEEIIINNFYNSKEEIYFFIPAQDKYKGLSKIIEVSGKVLFKKNVKPKIEFTNKNIVNIVERTEGEDEDEEEMSNMEKIKSRISKTQTKRNINKKEIQGSDFDRFSDNYLGDNRYYKCQISKNYSTLNPITELELGTFKRNKIIDNPETWKRRVDVNRPWDYK